MEEEELAVTVTAGVGTVMGNNNRDEESIHIRTTSNKKYTAFNIGYCVQWLRYWVKQITAMTRRPGFIITKKKTFN